MSIIKLFVNSFNLKLTICVSRLGRLEAAEENKKYRDKISRNWYFKRHTV